MKKLLVFIISILLIIPALTVNAAATYNVKTVEASIKDDVMTVKGTTENGVLAVAIFVYDENEENLITMITTSVTEENTYSDKIDIEDGNYVVKAANYDGGDYKETKVTKSDTETTTTTTTTKAVEETKEETTKKETSSPKTGDTIMKYVLILGIAIIGFVSATLFLKKSKNK